MNRHVLIDADVTLYKAAASCEVATDWGNGYWTWHCETDLVKNSIHTQIEEAMELCEASTASLALTDSERNFRLDVLPSYKGNRASVKKPLVLKEIRRWLLEDSEYDVYLRPRLEGDDVLGILSTWQKFHPDREKIIYSIDKDMRTVPGLYYRSAEKGIEEITPEYANLWHMAQTLAGDPVDGYSGCPGVGMKTALNALENGLAKEPYDHVLQRGKRAGEIETRYRDVEETDLWAIVVSYYKAAGLNEHSALEQARVARILQASDYNFKSKEPILWTPGR